MHCIVPNHSLRAICVQVAAGQKFRDRTMQKNATEARKQATVFDKDEIEDVFQDADQAAAEAN